MKGLTESEKEFNVVKEVRSHLKIWEGSIIIPVRFSDHSVEKCWQGAAWR